MGAEQSNINRRDSNASVTEVANFDFRDLITDCEETTKNGEKREVEDFQRSFSARWSFRCQANQTNGEKRESLEKRRLSR